MGQGRGRGPQAGQRRGRGGLRLDTPDEEGRGADPLRPGLSSDPFQLSPSWRNLGEGGPSSGARSWDSLRVTEVGGQPEFPSNFSRLWVSPESSPPPVQKSGHRPCASWAWLREQRGQAEAMASVGKPPPPHTHRRNALPARGFHPSAPPRSCGCAARFSETSQDLWVPRVVVGLSLG